MIPTQLVIYTLFLCSILHAHAAPSSSSSWGSWKRFWSRGSSAPARNVPPEGYYNPADKGGSILTKVPITYPDGQGEPLNAIITGLSDQVVLKDQETAGGLRNYFLSFGFSAECLGQHSGTQQAANLGDGNGLKNETSVIRWNYGDAQLGSCQETIKGGNHFRYWKQDGPDANSGAVFMAVSSEKPLNDNHDIIVNGYNLGRDYLVGNITGSSIPTGNLTNGTQYTAATSWAGYTYQSSIVYKTGLAPNTNDAINHNWSVGVGGINGSDGFVAVIDVKLTAQPKSLAWQHSPSFWQFLALLAVVTILSS